MTENTGHTGTAVNLDAVYAANRLHNELADANYWLGQYRKAMNATWDAAAGRLDGDKRPDDGDAPFVVEMILDLRDDLANHRAAATAVLDLIARYDAAVDGLIPGVTKNLIEGVLGHLRPLAGTRSDTDVAADYGIDLDGRRP